MRFQTSRIGGAFLFAGLATGCVQDLKSPKEVLIVGIENEVKNLDIRTASDANAWHVITLFSQGLVRVNDEFLPEPDLAESFEIQKGGKEFVFKLPPEARFHDGSPISSEDIKLTFEKTISERYQSGFSDVERYEAPDPRTFKIILKAPRASFLVSDLSLIRIFPKKYISDPNYGDHPVASGPYFFEKRENRDILLKRFDGYRFNRADKEAPLPTFERIIVRSIEDPITRSLSLMGGDIDILLNALSARKMREAAKSSSIQVLRGPGTSYSYLGFNFRVKKFRDLRVRKALALAIDRQDILNHKLLGYAQLANSVVPPKNFFHESSATQMPYDPVRAKALLKEAGAENLEVELKTSTDREVASVMLVIKEHWEKIGVKVTLRPAEFATFFSDVQKGNFEMFTLRWTGVTDPDQLNKSFHSKEIPPGKNRGYYSNSHVDALLDKAKVEIDLNKRKAFYSEVQKIVAEDLPYISLFYPDNSIVASSRLKNLKLHSTGAWTKMIYAHKE